MIFGKRLILPVTSPNITRAFALLCRLSILCLVTLAITGLGPASAQEKRTVLIETILDQFVGAEEEELEFADAIIDDMNAREFIRSQNPDLEIDSHTPIPSLYLEAKYGEVLPRDQDGRIRIPRITFRNIEFTILKFIGIHSEGIHFENVLVKDKFWIEDSKISQIELEHITGEMILLDQVTSEMLELSATQMLKRFYVHNSEIRSFTFRGSGNLELVIIDGLNSQELNISSSHEGILNVRELVMRNSRFTGEYVPFDLASARINAVIDRLEIRDTVFDPDVDFFESAFSDRFELVNNQFKGYVGLHSASLPEFNKQLTFGQFQKGLAIYDYLPGDFTTTGFNCDRCLRYTGDTIGVPELDSVYSNDLHSKLIASNMTLRAHYESVGDEESLKLVEESLANLRVKRRHNAYVTQGGSSNFLGWKWSELRFWFAKNAWMTLGLPLLVLVAGVVYFFRKGGTTRKGMVGKRLAAIVFSDIVGYSAMMGKDQMQAMSALAENRSLHQKLTRKNGGELLKEMGDGMLCSFNTASDSVNFCIEMQREMATRTDYEIRLGVHLGEVVFSKGDVFGDGVNIASRLQAEADDGGIVISETVYQNIRNQSDIQAEFLGEGDLKNISNKVKMYAVRY